MGEMGKVLRVARGQVVDANDGVALAEQAIGKVRTKESGGAGDKCTLVKTQFSKSEDSDDAGSAARLRARGITSHPLCPRNRGYAGCLRGLPSCAW